MKITKYGHACVVLEDHGKRVVIDPGEWTPDFGPADNIAAVVITHLHGDHFHPAHLHTIIQANPGVTVFTTPEVAAQWQDPHARAVHAYEDHAAGPFSFRFYGEQHAVIHHSAAPPENIGVLVNDFYFPGDSLVQADRDVAVLAVPAMAPWLKTGEAMDFLEAVRPSLRCFPTHNAMLSHIGQAVIDHWLGSAAKATNVNYAPLKTGESFAY